MTNQTSATRGLLASLLRLASPLAVLYVLYQFVLFISGQTSSPIVNTIDAGACLIARVGGGFVSNLVSGTNVAADGSFMHMIGTGLYYFTGAGVCVILAATVGMALFAASRLVEIGPRQFLLRDGDWRKAVYNPKEFRQRK
ncbi:hypothetical protein [Caballeronia sp. dw_19]|uniref:hypothetical protein n=1 Tax=Caballeronia sp. dw_19 TaxID=2719791 RepID=UPI001BD2241B|nr:hypothetical protein [Caballeronia sp. dw_19]